MNSSRRKCVELNHESGMIAMLLQVVAMACMNLASKIEECPRRIRDTINVFHHIKQLRSGK